MEKEIYTQPQVEVIRFASEDVITTSGIRFDPVNPLPPRDPELPME